MQNPPNPYAQPQAPFEPPPPAPPTGGGGGPLPWTVGDAVNWSFKALFSGGGRPAWQMAIPTLVLFGAMIPLYGMLFATSFANGFEAAQTGQAPPPSMAMFGVMGIFYPVMIVIQVWLFLGWTRYALQLGRGQLPTLGVLFKLDQLLPALGMAILAVLGIYVGYLLLIVPGIILSIGWMYAATFMVDQRLGPVDALKASWRRTSGSRWPLFGLMLLMGLIGFGLQLVCVGFFWSTPLMVLAMTYVYLRLNGEPGDLPGVPVPQGVPVHQG